MEAVLVVIIAAVMLGVGVAALVASRRLAVLTQVPARTPDRKDD